MADTNLSSKQPPATGGYSWYGVTGGVDSTANSLITSPTLALVRALSVQFHTLSGYVSADATQVSTANGDRVLAPSSGVLEIWRRASESAPSGSLTFYLRALAALAVTNTEVTIIVEWA